MSECKGYILKGKGCMKCEKCTTRMKKLVLQYAKTPLCKIPKGHVAAFSGSVLMLAAGMRSPTDFQKFLKGEIK